jgi:peptidoglycan hydrolase-like protein with peptidoglycan-binding domain
LALPVLSRGDKGISVLAMQAVLIARGFKCGWWGADGDFGSATEDALKGFQKHCEIEADGICGSETWAYLLGVRT